EITEGHFACTVDSDCPTDWTCRSDMRCWQQPGTSDGGGPDSGQSRADAGPDAGPSDAGTDAGFDACVPAPNDVDLLIMVDNSGSMAHEQAALATAFPDLIEALATGDTNGDGIADVEPITSLHVGVVSSDMGTGRMDVPTCNVEGDDGLLIGTPRGEGCSGRHAPPFLQFMRGDSTSALSGDFSCLAELGIHGCGFEQQLDAVLKALTPPDSPVLFRDGSLGHGGTGANAGFLRDDSVLVTLLVTDEEDCSTDDSELFNPGSTEYTDDLNIRCTSNPDALYPISRYVDGLLALRADPSQLVFAALVGMPVDLHDMPVSNVLTDPRMTYRVDPDMTARLLPACTQGDNRGDPGRRYLEVAQGLETGGAQVLARSICEPNFNDTVTALLQTMSPALQRRCL
ncbi:MAG TPA: hypothetical protein ENK57_13900, partial [Polyangiaceae bacterium]|nr:hypothetical protein [Polyangiaceae bacterium]